MKKIYIGIAALAICSTGFAQNSVKNTTPFLQKANYGSQVQATTPLQEKAVVLWSDDFSNMTNWTLTNTGSANVDWAQEMSPAAIPVAALSPFAATTAGNGFLFISSDANNTADFDGTFIISDATTATPIDLSATGATGQAEMNVILQFQHNFRWWNDIREVRVSGDNGVNWTTFQLSDASGSVIGGQNTGNPEVSSFNISAVAGGSSQVLIQFHYDDQDYWGWYWAVDDVQILRQEANDLALGQYFMGSTGTFGNLPYFQVPVDQIAPVEFSAWVDNIGSVDQPNTVLTVDVDGGASTLTSTSSTSIAGASDSLFTTAGYTPSATVGQHTFDLSVNSSLTDAAPLDNVAADSMTITPFIYARDRGVYAGGGGGADNANGDLAFEAGSVFDFFTTVTAQNVDIVIGSNTPAATIIYGKLFEMDNTGTFVYVDETAEYTTTQADADNNATISLQFFTSPTLGAGQMYMPVVGCYDEFYYGISGTSEPQTSFISYGGVGGTGSQYYTTQTPMVQFNFDPLGVEENIDNTMSLGQNMPNPFNATSQINYSVKSNANVNLTIVDMTGKVVMVINEGTKAAGDYTITLDASELAGGMYFYTLSNGTSSITKTMSVIK